MDAQHGSVSDEEAVPEKGGNIHGPVQGEGAQPRTYTRGVLNLFCITQIVLCTALTVLGLAGGIHPVAITLFWCCDSYPCLNPGVNRRLECGKVGFFINFPKPTGEFDQIVEED